LLLTAFVPGIAFAGPVDTDGDGVPDDTDTCPLTFNPGAAQTAESVEAGGNDGVPDACDNCKFASNANQCDSNDDGFGNRCDQDVNNQGSTGIVNAADYTNTSGTGFSNNFGGTGAACTRDQDFDDTTATDLINAVDYTNSIFGFSTHFGARLDGGVGGACPGGATCRSGRTCASLPSSGVVGTCPPEVGFFAP
jgi:hypothetical protein